MMKGQLGFIAAIATMVVVASSGQTQGAIEYTRTYGFYNVTGNNTTDAGIGEAQLQVQVGKDTLDSGVVYFLFENIGPEASSITDVYFEDGALLGGVLSIDGTSPGVAFSQNASPGDLPGGNAVDFTATAGFTADSDPPAQPNGVNPTEWLRIKFALQSPKTFDDVLASLDKFASDGKVAGESLRIGIHVQGFASGGSESFVNNEDPGGGITEIPEPASLAVWGLLACTGVGGVVARRRRKQA